MRPDVETNATWRQTRGGKRDANPVPHRERRVGKFVEEFFLNWSRCLKMRMSQRGLFRWGRQGTCRQQTAANLRTLVHRGVDPASEQAQDLSGGSVHKVDPNGTHLLFPADITLQPDIGFPGDAALQSDLHGLLMLEAIQERTRLEALWSKLQQESPSRSARTFCFRNGLSAVKKEDMRTFVPRLASLLSDSGFQLVTRRDQAVSSALEDHQGVMRGEVAVNEDNYSNLSSFLDAGAKNHLGAVLVWKRGHGIEVKTGLLFFRKLDFMQVLDRILCHRSFWTRFFRLAFQHIPPFVVLHALHIASSCSHPVFCKTALLTV